MINMHCFDAPGTIYNVVQAYYNASAVQCAGELILSNYIAVSQLIAGGEGFCGRNVLQSICLHCIIICKNIMCVHSIN